MRERKVNLRRLSLWDRKRGLAGRLHPPDVAFTASIETDMGDREDVHFAAVPEGCALPTAEDDGDYSESEALSDALANALEDDEPEPEPPRRPTLRVVPPPEDQD